MEIRLWAHPNYQQERKENLHGNCQGNAGPVATSGSLLDSVSRSAGEPPDMAGIQVPLWSGLSCGSWLFVAVNCVVTVSLKSPGGEFCLCCLLALSREATQSFLSVLRGLLCLVFRTLPGLCCLFNLCVLFLSARQTLMVFMGCSCCSDVFWTQHSENTNDDCAH